MASFNISKFLLIAIVLIAGSHCLDSDRAVFVRMDEFAETDAILMFLDAPAPPTVHMSSIQDFGDIVGGERDVQVSALEGNVNALFTVSTVRETLSFSSSSNTRSVMLIQYDGVDAEGEGVDETDNSIILNPTGLNGADLTANGLADSIYFVASSDLDTTLEFTLYTDATTISTYTFTLLATAIGEFREVEVPFADFVGDADFANAGAFEVRLLADTSVDATYSELYTSGPADPNNGKVYLMNPLPCAPEWPAVVPEFLTSTYSTTYTTTTSRSDDVDEDGDADYVYSSNDDSSDSSDSSSSNGRRQIFADPSDFFTSDGEFLDVSAFDAFDVSDFSSSFARELDAARDARSSSTTSSASTMTTSFSQLLLSVVLGLFVLYV